MEISEVVRKRGFKPSDRFDASKAEVLTSLTRKILHLEERSSGRMNAYPTDWRLRKILSPRTDFFQEDPPFPRIQKKVYASSDSFSRLHPTMDEEKSRAKEISTSITLPENANSKGQIMFQSRKKKSVKWVHQGNEYHKEIEEIRESPNWNSRSYVVPLQKSLSAGRFPVTWNKDVTPVHKKEFFHVQQQPTRGIVDPWKSYNTAARGYFQGQTIYHPIFLA